MLIEKKEKCRIVMLLIISLLRGECEIISVNSDLL